jgi:hypothetical protein
VGITTLSLLMLGSWHSELRPEYGHPGCTHPSLVLLSTMFLTLGTKASQLGSLSYQLASTNIKTIHTK